MNKRIIIQLTVVVPLMLVLMATPASAYVDPGSTTVVFQALLAGLGAASGALIVGRQRIAAMLRRQPRESAGADGEQSELAEEDTGDVA